MPRPRKNDLTLYQETIQQWIEEDIGLADVIQRLHQHFGLVISQRSLHRELRRLDIRINRPRIGDTAALKAFIVYTFHTFILKDEDMILLLRHNGFDIGKRTLGELRRGLGLYKKTPARRYEEVIQHIEEVLQLEFDQGNIKDYGRQHLYKYIRQKYNLVGR